MRFNDKSLCILTGVVLIHCAGPIAAHHSAAHIDRERTVEIRGTVVSYQYTNPHVHLVVDGIDTAGQAGQWTFEMQSPTVLRRYGWGRQTWAEGDSIVAVGNPSRTPGSKLADGIQFVSATDEVFLTSTVDEGSELTVLPVTENELVRIPAVSMEGIWELGRRDGRVGRPPAVYEFPGDELRSRFPTAHPSLWPFFSVLNEKSRDALNSFDREALGNPWCTPEPFFLSHYIEPVMLNLVLEDGRLTFQRPGDEFVVHFGAEHPAADQLFDWGHAIGEWDGETLLIDVANFAPNPWGLGRGAPSGAQKTVQHSISWADDRTMLYMSTIIFDPEYMTAPLTIESRFVHAPQRGLGDYAECTEESANLYIEDAL